MGYNTNFKGELKFTEELKAKQLAYIHSILGEDSRDHPEWLPANEGLLYMDLELTPDFSGIQWSGAEKTYNMSKMIELVIALMKKKWPEFGLKGTLLAQGEDIEDRYEIQVGKNGVIVCNITTDGALIECPHCGGKFNR